MAVARPEFPHGSSRFQNLGSHHSCHRPSVEDVTEPISGNRHTHTASGRRVLVPEECIGTGIFLRHLWSATRHSMREVGKFIRTYFATTSSLDVPWVTEVTWQPRGQGLNTEGWSGALRILSQFGTGAWVFIWNQTVTCNG